MAAWTKGDLAKQAFEELGLASYVFDLTADELQSAVRRMDVMVAEWDRIGIRIGYALSDAPNGSKPTDQSGVSDGVVQCIASNLAIKLAPSYGKTVSKETSDTAADGYSALLAKSVEMPQMQMPRSMPMGAGYKRRPTRPFFQQTDPLLAGNDGPIELE